tara:strand:- start:27 stop:164 length:138 start_codon:yes stop_codon:yes gene_type:complete
MIELVGWTLGLLGLGVFLFVLIIYAFAWWASSSTFIGCKKRRKDG